MRMTMMPHHQHRPPMRLDGTGAPGQVAVTVTACVVIVLVFLLIAILM